MNLRKGTFEQSLLLKPDRMDFVKLMQRWDNNPLKLQLPEDLEARPIALQFLAHSLADWNDDVQHLHIYTDGSFSPDMQVASFSFAVFGWNPSAEEDKSTFSGWLADVMLTDQLDPNYTGASHHSSMEAETAGLIWSHIWLIQSGCQLLTTFHYDSKTSGHGAAGLFQIGSNNHQLKKLRQLVHLVQRVRSGTTDYEHVKTPTVDVQGMKWWIAWPSGELNKDVAKTLHPIGNPSSSRVTTSLNGHGGHTALFPVIPAILRCEVKYVDGKTKMRFQNIQVSDLSRRRRL